MNPLAEYLVSVTGASIVCSGICCLMDKTKPVYAVVRLICGVFILTILLRPVLQIEIQLPDSFVDAASADTNDLIQQSIDDYGDDYKMRIKSNVETYIQEKLELMDCSLEAELTLREEYPNDPAHIKLTGTVSPYDRSTISKWLSTELGIAAEDQMWIG